MGGLLGSGTAAWREILDLKSYSEPISYRGRLGHVTVALQFYWTGFSFPLRLVIRKRKLRRKPLQKQKLAPHNRGA